MSLKNSLVVLWVYVMYVLGILIFLSGYLQKRIVLHQNNTINLSISGEVRCQNLTSLKTITRNFFNHQNVKKLPLEKGVVHSYDKAIIIIIDALRYDFGIKKQFPSEHERFYANKMPVFQEIVDKYPDQAIFIRTLADPPTTTLQRLKALTTGSLPTFIDISSNFAGSKILEDSIVRQMKLQGRNIIFMGDETWEDLFHGYFHRSFPFPSFNTKDLDTVDDGIIKHIYEEMNKTDSDIIIAHFLGVDHCGHRYGPKHPEMARKLSQTNIAIRKVIEKLSDDTILFVLGDHGMTESGDHGGDSVLEISSALFIYSPSKLLSNFNKTSQLEAAQINFVPTVSKLLGLPIPFSNLGAFIPQAFAFSPNNTCFDDELTPHVGTAIALAENSHQVNQYLQEYLKISNDLPHSIIKASEEQLKNISLLWSNISDDAKEAKSVLRILCSEYQEYLVYVKKECEKAWVTYDFKSIGSGLILMCASIIFNLLLTEHMDYMTLYVISTITMIFLCLFLLLYFSMILVCISLTIIMLLCFRHYLITLISNFIKLLTRMKNLTALITIIFFLASFSNSFIIYEDIVVMFLLQSLLLYRFSSSILQCFKNLIYKTANMTSRDKSKNFYKNLYKHLTVPVLFCCLMVLIRLQPLFKKCREDQFPCENSDFLISLENQHEVFSSSTQLMRLMLALSSVIIPCVVFRWVMSARTSQNSCTVAMICVKYGIAFVCVCTCLRWWLNIVPGDVIRKILRGNEVILTRAALITSCAMCFITSLFPILPEQPWKKPSKEVYSGSLCLLTVIIMQFLFLTAGDGMALTVTLMSLCIMLHLSLIENNTAPGDHEMLDTFTWSLMSRHWFYGTGHQPTFPSIYWDAAFLVDHKDVSNYILSAVFVTMNTFSSYILFSVALPFLLIWSKSSMYSVRGVLRFQLNYLLFFGIKLLGTMMASTVLRLHLMTWSIFTPKLIFDASAMLITLLFSLLSVYFMSRVTSCYHALIKSNCGHVFSQDEKQH